MMVSVVSQDSLCGVAFFPRVVRGKDVHARGSQLSELLTEVTSGP